MTRFNSPKNGMSINEDDDALFKCEFQPVPSAENQNIQPKQPILQPFINQEKVTSSIIATP
jgi:hypothetical protein